MALELQPVSLEKTPLLETHPGVNQTKTNASLGICIPAYNAAQTLESVLSRIPIEVWNRLMTLVIVNDGSTDETASVVKLLASKYKGIQSIHFPYNQGYGFAVREGLLQAAESHCDYVVCLHADGQYAPEKILELMEAMEAGPFDILQGSRHLKGRARLGGMPLYKIVAGKFLTHLENICFDLHLTDYHSGYLMYRSTALAALPLNRLSGYFDFDLEVIACGVAQRLRIGEIAIPTRYAGEKSHLNPIRYGLRVLKVLWKFRRGDYHPKKIPAHG